MAKNKDEFQRSEITTVISPHDFTSFGIYGLHNLMVAEGCYHGWISLSNALIPAISLVCIIQGPAFIWQILTYSSA